MKLRDVDAVVLLLLLCEIRQLHPEALECPMSNWRNVLSDYIFNSMLRLSGIEASGSDILIKYVDTVSKCTRFVKLNEGGKCRKDVATSVAAIIALPCVEMSGGGRECVICKEEMEMGRDVCELPCEHLFHWMCILPWLTKKNTCPYCRHRLPTDDVVGEIQRLWEHLAKIATDVTVTL